MTPDHLDAMRRALTECSFLPGSGHKRFVRSVAAMPLNSISGAQERNLIRLAWRYRRQMPREMVPSKEAVDALDAGWQRRARADCAEAFILVLKKAQCQGDDVKWTAQSIWNICARRSGRIGAPR